MQMNKRHARHMLCMLLLSLLPILKCNAYLHNNLYPPTFENLPNQCGEGRNLTIVSWPHSSNKECKFNGCTNTAQFDCTDEVVATQQDYDKICELCDEEMFGSSTVLCNSYIQLTINWTTPAMCQFNEECENQEWFECTDLAAAGKELEICELCERPFLTHLTDQCGTDKNLTIFNYTWGRERIECEFAGECSYSNRFDCADEVASQDLDAICEVCELEYGNSANYSMLPCDNQTFVIISRDTGLCKLRPGCRNREWFDCTEFTSARDLPGLCALCEPTIISPIQIESEYGFETLLYPNQCGVNRSLITYSNPDYRLHQLCRFEGCPNDAIFDCREELHVLESGSNSDDDALICSLCDNTPEETFQIVNVPCSSPDYPIITAYWSSDDSTTTCWMTNCPNLNTYITVDDCKKYLESGSSSLCDFCDLQVFAQLNEKFSECPYYTRMTTGRYCPNYCGEGKTLFITTPDFSHRPLKCSVEGCGDIGNCEELLLSTWDQEHDRMCDICSVNTNPSEHQQIVDGDDDNDSSSSCNLYEECAGLDGNCCSTDSGIDLHCCQTISGNCQDHPACSAIAGLEGSCCPTLDGIFLDCCEKDFAKCEAHNSCSHLTGDCCPTESGIFLDCCRNDNSLNAIRFPQSPELAACSAHSECSNLDGGCCPTTTGVYLYCCDRISEQCERHPKCSALGLEGTCCPTLDGIYLDCCERPFADASAHSSCWTQNLEGNLCPDSEGIFHDCCLQDQTVALVQFAAVVDDDISQSSSSAGEKKAILLYLPLLFLSFTATLHCWF